MGGVRPRASATPWLLFIAAVTPVFVHSGSCGESIGRAEFRCQEAAQKIVDCCGKVVGMSCSDHGCGPLALSLEEGSSTCIRDASCESLIAAGVCEIRDWNGYEKSCEPASNYCDSDAGTDGGSACVASRQELCSVKGKLSCP